MNVFTKLKKYLIKLSLKVEKRVRFVLSAVIMCSLIVFASLFEFNMFWVFIPVFVLSTYILTYFSVLEGIEGAELLMLFLMPVLFTVSFYLFYFLFPIRWLTRVPFIVLYGISIYAILLTSNIFNVGVEKNLQLQRAAFAVNYFFQSLLVFLLANVLFSFKQNAFINGGVMFVAVLPLALQLLWTVKLNKKLERKLLSYSFLIAVMIGQSTILMSFVPLKSTILALFVTALYYSLGGIIYHFIDDRLFKNVVREYMLVLGFVSILVLLSVSW